MILVVIFGATNIKEGIYNKWTGILLDCNGKLDWWTGPLVDWIGEVGGGGGGCASGLDYFDEKYAMLIEVDIYSSWKLLAYNYTHIAAVFFIV